MGDALETEWVVAVEGTLPDMKGLASALKTAGVLAEVGMRGCDKPSCSPKAQLLVRPEDLQRLAQLMKDRWHEALTAEGLAPAVAQDGRIDACPACGTAAPLVAGACSDCGLQLEDEADAPGPKAGCG